MLVKCVGLRGVRKEEGYLAGEDIDFVFARVDQGVCDQAAQVAETARDYYDGHAGVFGEFPGSILVSCRVIMPKYVVETNTQHRLNGSWVLYRRQPSALEVAGVLLRTEACAPHACMSFT